MLCEENSEKSDVEYYIWEREHINLNQNDDNAYIRHKVYEIWWILFVVTFTVDFNDNFFF